MTVYRIARPKWIHSFTGSGVAGRWNSTGALMLYTSSSLALALLEILAHIKRDQLPSDYAWTEAHVSDELIANGGYTEVPDDSAAQGTAWLEARGGKLALAVPSVIVPERNILLNPTHTDFA